MKVIFLLTRNELMIMNFFLMTCNNIFTYFNLYLEPQSEHLHLLTETQVNYNYNFDHDVDTDRIVYRFTLIINSDITRFPVLLIALH